MAIEGVHIKQHPFLTIPHPRPFPGLMRCPYRNAWRAGTETPEAPTVRYYSRFLEDVTIEDGTVLAPGTKFVKVWRISNNGASSWPENTSLIPIGGDVLSSVQSVPVTAVPAGQAAEVSVEMTAPRNPGRYISNWRLCSPTGGRFGHRVWVDILVAENEERPVEVAPVVSLPETSEVPPLVPEVEDVTLEEEKKEETKPEPETNKPVLHKREDLTPLGNQKKVDDDVPEGPIKRMLIELYDMGFTDRGLNRRLLVKNKADIVATVHELLSLV